MMPSKKVARVVDTVFCLKENPRSLDFIIEVGLRACGLAPVGDPQVAFAANPLITIPLPVGEATLKLTSDL